MIGPRLTDPKACSNEIMNRFRFAEEKEVVHDVLKARAQTLNSSAYGLSKQASKRILTGRNITKQKSTGVINHNSNNNNNNEKKNDNFMKKELISELSRISESTETSLTKSISDPNIYKVSTNVENNNNNNNNNNSSNNKNNITNIQNEINNENNNEGNNTIYCRPRYNSKDEEVKINEKTHQNYPHIVDNLLKGQSSLNFETESLIPNMNILEDTQRTITSTIIQTTDTTTANNDMNLLMVCTENNLQSNHMNNVESDYKNNKTYDKRNENVTQPNSTVIESILLESLDMKQEILEKSTVDSQQIQNEKSQEKNNDDV